MLRGIAFAGNDVVLRRFAVDVKIDGPAGFGIDEIDLDLAVAAILPRISGVVRQQILVTDGGANVRYNFGNITLEARLVELASSELGEGLHLVIGLQEIQAVGGAGHDVAGIEIRIELLA